jgi:hypothetical protein
MPITCACCYFFQDKVRLHENGATLRAIADSSTSENVQGTLTDGSVESLDSNSEIELVAQDRFSKGWPPSLRQSIVPEARLVKSTMHYDSRCMCPCHGLEKSLNSRELPRPVQNFLEGESQFSAMSCRCELATKRKKLNKSKEKSSNLVFLRSNCFKKTFLIALVARGFRIRVYFRCHNLVPETAESMRCAQSGDFDTLEKLIKSNKATVNDTTPDGWSLLHVCFAYTREHCLLADYLRRRLFMSILILLSS